VESNTPELIAHTLAQGRLSEGENYAAVLRAIEIDLETTIFAPYASESLPSLEGIDGVIFTGSGVAWCVDDPRAAPLANTMQAVFSEGQSLPAYGSCNGMQLAAHLLGGSCGPSSSGREDGIARSITLSASGRTHQMMAGRAAQFAAVCVHRDEVGNVSEGAVVLASNASANVQAMAYEQVSSITSHALLYLPYQIRITHTSFWWISSLPTLDTLPIFTIPHHTKYKPCEQNGVCFWGSQYHPELSPDYVGAILEEIGQSAELVEAMKRAGDDSQVAVSLGTTVIDMAADIRTLELQNWLKMVGRSKNERATASLVTQQSLMAEIAATL
jgi:GMP synthase (glutamine-hydrolysing)